jgi:hypothetical protein
LNATFIQRQFYAKKWAVMLDSFFNVPHDATI